MPHHRNRHTDPGFYEIDPTEHIPVGRDPRALPTDLLRSLDGPQSPIKAIRAKCLDCCAGQIVEVRRCVDINCALWPFRMGKNVFHSRAGKHEETDDDNDAH